MDASPLVGAEAETRSGAIVAISGVLVGEVKKVVQLKIVRKVRVAIRVAITYLIKR